jgi:glutamine amidotransferase
MKVVIIKYNAGNIRSVDYALKRLGVEAHITGNFEEILSADKVIFPGVGEAANTMRYLKENKLDQLIVNMKQPVLGICLGLQLMCKHSEEGNTSCLGIFDEKVLHFDSSFVKEHVKVPHMGWNTIFNLKKGIFDASLENEYVYFVHSYYAAIGEHTAATTNYIVPFSASLQKDNFYATQFHPEKSGDVGTRIIQNFLNI